MRATRVGSVKERFEQRYSVDPATGCWNWTQYLNVKGYGEIGGVVVGGVRYAPKGQKVLAHRVSWLLHRGPIPDSDAAHGMVVMHSCDNPRCVNPDHLKLGTQADNVADMLEKGRKVTNQPKGVKSVRAKIKDPAALVHIRSTVRQTKALAEKYGVGIDVIKRIRNGQCYAA